MRTKFILVAIISGFISHAQVALKSPPSGGNKKASVSEEIGITDVKIEYNRPGVKGREGKIYGTAIVPIGYQVVNTAEPGVTRNAPWRAGANENTTIEFSTDVKIEGKNLPAGKYGFFVAYDPNECTVIFSKNSVSWGHFFYNENEDALRVKVKPVILDKSVEWLKYEFINQTENSATLALQWEKTMIPFKIEVDLIKTELDDYRAELRGEKGFSWEPWSQAATLCLENNTDLKEGSLWANIALRSQKNFQTLSTKAKYVELEGNKVKSDSLMKVAVDMGSMVELHQYGRQLIGMKKNAEALQIFKTNAKKNPKQFTTYVGLARGYSANGDYKNALVNAKIALPLAPNDVNKKSVADMIEKLTSDKDIN